MEVKKWDMKTTIALFVIAVLISLAAYIPWSASRKCHLKITCNNGGYSCVAKVKTRSPFEALSLVTEELNKFARKKGHKYAALSDIVFVPLDVDIQTVSEAEIRLAFKFTLTDSYDPSAVIYYQKAPFIN